MWPQELIIGLVLAKLKIVFAIFGVAEGSFILRGGLIEKEELQGMTMRETKTDDFPHERGNSYSWSFLPGVLINPRLAFGQIWSTRVMLSKFSLEAGKFLWSSAYHVCNEQQSQKQLRSLIL